MSGGRITSYGVRGMKEGRYTYGKKDERKAMARAGRKTFRRWLRSTGGSES